MSKVEENDSTDKESGKRREITQSDSQKVDDAELELLREQYLSLREEVHLRIELQNKRLTQGLTVIGAIIGYGLVSENHAVIATTPFILGALYIESARMYRQIGSLANHMLKIENTVQEIAPLFCWESEYGGFFGVSDGIGDFSWYRVPTYGLAVFAVGAYVALSWISIRFWPPNFGTWFVNSSMLAVVWIIYAVLVLFVWYSAHRYIRELPDRE